MPASDVLGLLREVLGYDLALSEHRPSAGSGPSVALRADLSHRSARARARLAEDLAGLMSRLGAGDVSAAGPALDYLEADPFYFRSGYARTKLAGRLSRVTLGGEHARRARALVLAVVDGTAHSGLTGIARLAGSVADNELRRALRDRLRSPDVTVAGRALRVLVRVRHPGLTSDELTAARVLVLADAGRQPYLMPSVARLARWLWAPQWQRELAELTRRHGPDRAGAARLVEQHRRTRGRRPGS